MSQKCHKTTDDTFKSKKQWRFWVFSYRCFWLSRIFWKHFCHFVRCRSISGCNIGIFPQLRPDFRRGKVRKTSLEIRNLHLDPKCGSQIGLLGFFFEILVFEKKNLVNLSEKKAPVFSDADCSKASQATRASDSVTGFDFQNIFPKIK